MKKISKNLWKSSMFFLLFTGWMFTGCSENNDVDGLSKDQEDELAAVEITEIDEISEGINAIIESVYLGFESRNELLKSTDDKYEDYLPDCVTITKTISTGFKKVEIDFSDEGCEMPGGNVLKGKIIVEITLNMETQSIEIAYSFDNFYFNDKKIEGSLNKIRLRENENGNPEATNTKDIKIIWEDGSSAEVKGTRVREWIMGYGNRNWADNVFSITGEWTVKRRNGSVYEAVITNPLIRKMACRFIVSGTISITRGDNQIILDYGDGTCDDLATITVNGITKEIHLGQRNTDSK